MLTSVVLKALPCCYVPGHVPSPCLSTPLPQSTTTATMKRCTDQLGVALGAVVDVQKEFSDVKKETQR